MKKSFFFFLFVPMTLFAADYQIEQISFYPEPIYIGDEVTCRVEIRKSVDDLCENPSEPLPVGDHFRFTDISVEDAGEYAFIDIRFAPYTVGIFYLPEIRCGQFNVTGIRVNVHSLKEKDASFSETAPASVYRLRGFYGVTVIIACVFMIFSVVGFMFFPLWGVRIKRRLSRLFRRNPFKTFSAACRNWERNIESIDSKQLYDEMTDGFRLYLTQRTGENFFSVTTRAFPDRMAAYLIDSDLREKTFEILKHSDTVRFGSSTEGILREKRDLTEIREIVCQIEEFFNKRRIK